MMYTAGSNAVTAYFRPLRTFGAQVRRVLLNNAARHWGVPVDELTTDTRRQIDARSGEIGRLALHQQLAMPGPGLGGDTGDAIGLQRGKRCQRDLLDLGAGLTQRGQAALEGAGYRRIHAVLEHRLHDGQASRT